MRPSARVEIDSGQFGLSRGRPAMPRDRIIREALALVDETGADALSLRSLATRLGSSTSTLYRHFADRANLTDEVVDAVFGEIMLQVPERLDWPDELHRLATSMFDALTRHQNATPLMLEGIPPGRNVLALRERTLAVLLCGGLSSSDAVRAFAMVGRFVLGFGVQARIAGSLAVTSPDPELSPASAQVAKIDPLSLHDEFRFGLQLLIRGLQSISDSGRQRR